MIAIKLSLGVYLLVQAVGSVLVNGAINGALCWLVFHDAATVGMWGVDGFALDTLLTGIVLPALSVLIGTRFVRKDVEAGRAEPVSWRREDRHWLRLFPHRVLSRAVIFALLFAALSVPATLGWLLHRGVEAMTYDGFFVFKLVFACGLGIVVTPLNALWVLTERANSAPRAAEDSAVGR